jgi:urea transport system substrate-binding protein
MAISEVSVKDAELMAIDEINSSGGVLGKKLEPIIEDGASDCPTFADKARKLIEIDKVPVVFGCWTSASRKAVLPIFESMHGLLFYPVQYEGLEASTNIFYTGATTNQQTIPAVDYLLKNGKKRIYLLGSDYVYPRTTNIIIKAQLNASGGTVAGENYVPLGGQDFADIINKIVASHADAILNTLNGDSNVSFFRLLKKAGITADTIPVMSVSIAEEEARHIGPSNLAGHLAAWNYFETTKTDQNSKFVATYKNRYGQDRVTDDPIEAGYIAVYLWKAAVEKAGSFEVDKVISAANGVAFSAPEGPVHLDETNHHTWKIVRIGKFQPDGLINEIYSSITPVHPRPFLETYPWAHNLRGYHSN